MKNERINNRDSAWDFMHSCDIEGISAGFPNWNKEDNSYSVQYKRMDVDSEEVVTYIACFYTDGRVIHQRFFP